MFRSAGLIVLSVLFTGSPAFGQKAGGIPPRPALSASADTNSARAYYEHGAARLRANPREAAQAFFWAHQLDPTSAEALYGRYTALLLSEPQRLLRYWQGERRTVRSREVLAIDSLYWKALNIDPFLYRKFENEVFRTVVATWYRNEVDKQPGGLTVGDGAIFRWTNQYLQHGGPFVRAREAYSQGRHADALKHYEDALRNARRKSFIRTERARVMALMHNTDGALAEMQVAVNELRKDDERDLVFLYESKALLEHSIGVLHERKGATALAREAYARAIQEDMSFHPAQQRLAMLSLAAGDTLSAVSTLDLAIQARPDEPVLRHVYGGLLTAIRRHEEAEEHLEQAIVLAPHFAEPHFALGLAREMRGDLPGAVTSYQRFVASAGRDHPRKSGVQERIARLEGLIASVAVQEGSR